MINEPDFEELDARDRKEALRREASRIAALYDYWHWRNTGELVRLPAEAEAEAAKAEVPHENGLEL